MEDLRIPKRQVPVEVVLPGGQSRRVSLFLAENAAGHEGPQRVSDLLNGHEPFYSLLEREGVALVSRAHVARVAIVAR
jgi:hypothetical protein